MLSSGTNGLQKRQMSEDRRRLSERGTVSRNRYVFKLGTACYRRRPNQSADNTNPDPAARAVWIELAKKNNATVRCVWFKTSPALCEHNDTVRSANKVVCNSKALALCHLLA